MQMSKQDEIVEIRQQVRIVSHVGENIAFTPDIVVVPSEAKIQEKTDDHSITWVDHTKMQGRVSMPLWIQNKLARYCAPRKIVATSIRWGRGL